MEFYNTFAKEYLNALSNMRNDYLIKLELLSDNETTIGEIIRDLSSTDGQININYEQITRRSCSLSLINIDRKYMPNKNGNFWLNRKFKLWIGLVVRDNVYWWSQGVYYTQSAVVNNGTVNIEAVDKGGVLDGALKLGMTDSQYVIKRNRKLVDVVSDLLTLRVGDVDIVNKGNMRLGGDRVLDCILPHINTVYKNEVIQAELSIDANEYIGELMNKLAELYAAEIYYDADGHFVFEPYVDNSGYSYMPTQWTFTNLSSFFEEANYNYSFDGENAVCVYTNSNETGVRNVAWTAYNTNPLSPLNISTGIRRAPHQEIEYYNTSEEQMIKDCRTAANYYLRHHSLIGMQLNFNCPIIPHIDVNKTIEISDNAHDIANGIFVVQSVTIPLNSSAMNISCSNINWLPNDTTYDGVSEILEGDD